MSSLAVLEETIGLAEGLSLKIVGPCAGGLSVGIERRTGGELVLDEVTGPREGESEFVRPTGGRLSPDDAVGPADVKLPG